VIGITPKRAHKTHFVALAECHRFTALGKKIVVHVPTRHFFSFDERAGIAMDLLGQGPQQRADFEAHLTRQMGRENAREVVRRLDIFGLIVDPEEPKSDPLPESRQQYIGVVDLNVCSACNLRCRYCFISFNEEHQKWDCQAVYDTGPTLMSMETARRAVDFLLASSGPSPQIQIIFFGGEPLMALDLIHYIAEYAVQKATALGKAARLCISTNGTLINPQVLNMVERYNMDFQVSLDGPPDIHDRYRTLKNGRPTYQIIIDNLASLPRPLPVNISARSTLHRHSLDILHIVKHLRKLGFRSILVSPVHGIGEWALRAQEWQRLSQSLEETAVYYLESIRAGEFFYFPPLAGVSLTHAPEQIRFFSCGAGRQYLCVHTDGEIYLCHTLVGIDSFRLGDVYEGIRSDLLRRVAELHASARDGCRGCWARYQCGGGCLAVHLEETGDIASSLNGPRCDYIRRMFELSMGLRACLTPREIEIIQKEFELAPDVCPPSDWHGANNQG